MPPEESPPMDLEDTPPKVSDPQPNPTTHEDPQSDDDGFVTVLSNRVRHQMKITISDETTITGSPPTTLPTRNSNVPAPPRQRYTKTARLRFFKKKKTH